MMAISAAAGPSSAARLGRCSWSGLACARAPLHLCPLCHGAPTRWAAVLLLLLLLADGLVQAAPSPAAAANSTYVGYAAICVVGKNENRYIREWVDYHKCLGFSRIYVYDHGSKDRMSTHIEDHIASGFVNYTYFTGHHKKFKGGFSSSLERFSRTAQGYAYKTCVKQHRKHHTFLGFIDFDEFLVFTNPNITSVNQLLKPYAAYGGLALHWILAGANNHTARPNDTVLNSFTTCLPKKTINHRQFKAFVNTRHHPQMFSPHRCFFRKPKNGKGYLVNEKFRKIKTGFSNTPTHNSAAVYHYVTKSYEDYEQKLKRGGGAGVTRDEGFFKYIQRKATMPCTGARDLNQRLCIDGGSVGG